MGCCSCSRGAVPSPEAATSYYDILGVGPSSDHEAIRQAFVSKALLHHPDHAPSDDPDMVAEAAYRMREVNEAWSVLRDPEKRAGYDRSIGLRPSLDPLGAAGAGGNADDFPFPEGMGEYQQGDPRQSSPWWWLGPVIALLVIMLGVVVVALVQEPTASGPEVRTGTTFEPGMCVVVRPGPDVVEAPCGAQVSGRIVEVVDYPRPCTDGDLKMVVLRVESVGLCLEPV